MKMMSPKEEEEEDLNVNSNDIEFKLYLNYSSVLSIYFDLVNKRLNDLEDSY